MKRIKKKNIGIIFIVIAILFFIGASQGWFSNPFSITYQGKEVIPLKPVMASYSCDVIDSDTDSFHIPEQGYWLSRQDIGINTNLISSIQVNIEKTGWQALLDRLVDGVVDVDYRILYKICDENKQNCVEHTDSVFTWGEYTLSRVPSAINLQRESLYVVAQRRVRILFWGDWENIEIENSKIRFAWETFGLKLSSTTIGFGETICTTGCDLTCPSQSIREKQVYNPETTLDFYEVVSYLEDWETIPDLPEQFGGTTWVQGDEVFCLGGRIYEPGVLDMQNVNDYVYPKTFIRTEQCCPGAIADLGTGNQICNNNYKWEPLTSNPPCASDINCPGQGLGVCQLLGGKYTQIDWGCVGGTCQEGEKIQVDCCPPNRGCPSDQVCQEGKCVSGGVIPPEESCVTDSDCITKPGGKCIQGKCRYPGETTGKCANCDEYAMSTLFGSIFKGKKCKGTLIAIPPQTFTTCIFSFLRLLLVPIVFIFTTLFSIDFLERFKTLKGNKNKGLRLLISVVLGIILGYIVYVSFWIGVIGFVIYILLNFFKGFIGI